MNGNTNDKLRGRVKEVLLTHLKGKNAEARIELCLDELMPVLEGSSPPKSKGAFGVVMTQSASENKVTNDGQDGFNGRPKVV